MPNMANITVKAANGTTDVVYTALTPSAGDKTPARWQVLTSSTRQGLRTGAEMTSRFNAGGNARVVRLELKMPHLETLSGVETSVGVIHVNIQATLPGQVAQNTLNEAIAQAANLFKATLVNESFTVGYAPQ